MPPLIKHPKDFFSGLIYAAVGLAAILIGRDYPLGSALKMGPAYFPTVLGGALLLIGLICVARAFVIKGEAIPPFAWKALLLVLAATVLFGVTVRGAGLVPALLVLVVMSAYASMRFRFSVALALAAGMTVFSVLVFIKGLGVPLVMIGPWFGR